MTALHWLAFAQAGYYLITGLWPLVHIGSFMAMTGPKRDLWLVRTVGVLVTAVALALAQAAWQDAITRPTATLASGCAAGLAAIDVIYVARRTIAPIYLLDAALEAVILAAWLLLLPPWL
jgi:hypothetical protein